MPPFGPRKRASPPSNDNDSLQPPNKKRATADPNSTPRRHTGSTGTRGSKTSNKGSLRSVPQRTATSATGAKRKAYLDLDNSEDESSDEDSDGVSELDSDDFEDVDTTKHIPASRKRTEPHAQNIEKHTNGKGDEEDEDDEDEDMDWEDALHDPSTHTAHGGNEDPVHSHAPIISGDLELTLDNLPTNTLSSFVDPHGKKKGPSKIERSIRTNTHCMHVMYLMFHNLWRNGWCCDAELHKILVSDLSPGIKKEVERWKRACGDTLPQAANGTYSESKLHRKKEEGERKVGANDQTSARNIKKKNKKQRDWGKDAVRAVNDGKPDLSHGDPTIKLLKVLVAYWKKRFTVSAPGIRKQGYKDLARLEDEVRSFRQYRHDADEHGERIKSKRAFRELARRCTGSRDAGAQLFTALLRSLGMEARLVASLQPVGFGWSKSEDAEPRKERKGPREPKSESEAEDESARTGHTGAERSSTSAAKVNTKPVVASAKHQRGRSKPSAPSKGDEMHPISLSTDESELSSIQSIMSDSDSSSLLDVTPAKPVTTPSNKRFDRDLPFPVYWTEVLSPITQTWIPVDAITLGLVANNPESITQFEPRGAKADKAKQVMAYIVAFSSDGTAKDVTVRYLKRHMWPGKTKGVRLPTEKLPVYNKRGKVKYYEDYDWFKTVMAAYARSSHQRTSADEKEEITDLVPQRVVRDASKVNEETLQGYKNSEEFVLERHLKREEALLPKAKIIRHFTTGKGDKAKSEPVFLRKDVVKCKTLESWHKEGREIITGQHPLKHVPMRAVTLTRKREVEEVERETGEKQKQPLYSRNQTQWIIPPPIRDGIIPKNAYGNMDVYVPTMVPKGAVHIPFRGTARVCRKLEIDHAEACTGFEFGNKMAVPILTGVVVAKENEERVIEAWRVEEEAKRKKEKEKRDKLILGTWKKMLAGLLIVQRVRAEYGQDADSHIEEAIHPMSGKKSGKKRQQEEKASSARKAANGDVSTRSHNRPLSILHDSEADAGGFEREDHIDDNMISFLGEDNDEDEFAIHQEPGGFILEDDDQDNESSGKKTTLSALKKTPISLQSMHKNLETDYLGDEDEAFESEQGVHGQEDQQHAPPQSSWPPSSKKGRPAKGKSARQKKGRKVKNHGDYGKSSKDEQAIGSPAKDATRPRSTRPAAGRSSTAVRSHYFDSNLANSSSAESRDSPLSSLSSDENDDYIS